MPTTRQYKSKARKSRKAELISDLEKVDIMLGSDTFEREDSESGSSARRHEVPSYDALIDHNTYSYSYSRERNQGIFRNLPELRSD